VTPDLSALFYAACAEVADGRIAEIEIDDVTENSLEGTERRVTIVVRREARPMVVMGPMRSDGTIGDTDDT